MDRRMKDALDRHITGNYGENQFKEYGEEPKMKQTITKTTIIWAINEPPYVSPTELDEELKAFERANPVEIISVLHEDMTKKIPQNTPEGD